VPTAEPVDRISFSAAEHRDRVATVATGVRARGLDAVLAWSRGGATVDSAADVLWLTGFYNPWLAVPDSQCWSGQSHCAALVTADGECVLVTNIPAHEWRDGGVVADDVIDEPFIELGVASALRARSLEMGRIGLAGRTVLPVALFDKLRAALPEVAFVPADEILLEARRPKSAAEAAAIRDTGRVGALTMEAMLAASQPGAREIDVASAAYAATIAAGGVPYSISLATGPNEDRLCPWTLPTWSGRTLQAGDLWHCDLAGIRGGYLFDFARTTVVGGAPNGEQLEMMEAAIATVEAVIALIEPGRAIGDAVAQGHAVQRRLAPFAPAPGKHDYPHLGHTLGLGFGDIWLYENEQRPFEAQMYVAVEAVVGRPDGGFAMFEENLLVGADGAEVVTVCRKRPWEAP
jgi:Xaa-Pro aminopeptidase